MADQIGVYHAERIYGPHSVTNIHNPNTWTCCSYTAEFKLQKTLRGNPPATYSRSRQVDKPELLGFHAGDTYIFFFVAEERLKNVRVIVDSTSEAFFGSCDYIWLERPQVERDGAAIDYRGRIITNQTEILKLIDTSLNLPRASRGIDRWAYLSNDKSMYPDSTNFNFHVISFPTPDTQDWVWRDWHHPNAVLVIPKCLIKNDLSKTNETVSPAGHP